MAHTDIAELRTAYFEKKRRNRALKTPLRAYNITHHSELKVVHLPGHGVNKEPASEQQATMASSLSYNFSNLRLEYGIMTTSSSSCNDTIPQPAATRLDISNTQGPVPFPVIGGSRPKLPEEHLAFVLALGRPAKEAGKINPPIGKAGHRSNGPLMAARIVKEAVENRNQGTDGLRAEMREEL